MYRFFNKLKKNFEEQRKRIGYSVILSIVTLMQLPRYIIFTDNLFYFAFCRFAKFILGKHQIFKKYFILFMEKLTF